MIINKLDYKIGIGVSIKFKIIWIYSLFSYIFSFKLISRTWLSNNNSCIEQISFHTKVLFLYQKKQVNISQLVLVLFFKQQQKIYWFTLNYSYMIWKAMRKHLKKNSKLTNSIEKFFKLEKFLKWLKSIYDCWSRSLSLI